MRETDRWLRKVAIYAPIMTFLIGFGSGVITTGLVYREIAHQVTELKNLRIEQDHKIEHLQHTDDQVITFLERWGFRVQ